MLANRYEVIREIGEGGMQVVSLAKDHVFQREVAIKRAKSKSAIKRFARSAKLSGSINHPNVAKTLDYFTEDGTQYLVEEYLPGGDLAKGVQTRLERVDPFLAARILHHLAKGLRAAHAAAVVHRDIKPANILFQSTAMDFQVKFTDFGIAKMAEEELVEAVADGAGSSSSTFLGAIPYMAPEMLRNTRVASFPADVWSVAAVVYELLAGRRPFGAGVDAFDAIRAGKPPLTPVDDNVRRQFLPLTEDVWGILHDCFDPDPAERPTAAILVSQCEQLCYPIGSRELGEVIDRRYNWGIITASSGERIFYHNANVFGSLPEIGDQVMFTSYPGFPQPRAIPVVKLR